MKITSGVHAPPRNRKGDLKDLRQFSIAELFQRFFLSEASPSPCFNLGKKIFDSLDVSEGNTQKDV